jgi:exosortase A-associated hydrolase 1
MSYVERPLTIHCEGDELVGIVASPQSPRSVAVLIVVGGPQYRVGSHRQFVLLARRLAEEGYATLRFDCRGMGDSGGDPRGFDRMSADIAAAIDALAASGAGVGQVVLWGLCDAASAALIYADERRDPRVAGMALLNPWVRSDASLAKTHIKHYYGKRLLERDFWTKVARGGIGVGAALEGLAGSIVRATKRNAEAAPDARSYQDRMAQGLAKFAGPVLLILSGRDLTAKEFVEYAQADDAWRAALGRAGLERRELPDADHTFSSERSSREVESQTLAWLSGSVLAAAR